MTNSITTRADVKPSATIADEAELAVWNALSRDEQARRYREVLADPACDRITDAGMGDVLAAARQRVAARRHG
jgi:hypothetical protein